MSKKVVILKSSPRGTGNSSVLADQVRKGAESAGAQVESFHLDRMNIAPCSACDCCKRSDGCVVEDDMSVLYPKLLDADAVVLASPVYWFTFSAQLKTCIDRWYGMENQHGRQFMNKKFGIILTYGDSDFARSGAENAINTLKAVCGYLRSEIVGIVCLSALDVGDVEQQRESMDIALDLGVNLVI